MPMENQQLLDTWTGYWENTIFSPVSLLDKHIKRLLVEQKVHGVHLLKILKKIKKGVKQKGRINGGL
jgi:hypothetical protein